MKVETVYRVPNGRRREYPDGGIHTLDEERDPYRTAILLHKNQKTAKRENRIRGIKKRRYLGKRIEVQKGKKEEQR